ncbi:hypothetical protein [Sphingomonas nostoxanthinifaciens]|uniref:hypothetical protein n=1 Tax=Sphingomonas nostoxanthinifaciens TaxID=2872652 RepID=UPI001CC21439|nr:hypothetical protein [Sphingomonas nostoxanthinifaciens]UAK23944.1 hypothetical protein K8P63_16525 [Sphingomonas nostoxanthinifaciens]
MKGLTKLALAGGLVLGTAPAMATVVYSGYDNNVSGGAMLTSPNADAAQASFVSGLQNVLGQSFESYSSGAHPATWTFTGASGSTTASVTGAGQMMGSYTRSSPVPNGPFATDGSKFYTMEASSFTISFADAVQGLGFYATDIESDLTATLLLASGATETYSFDTLFNSSVAGSGSVDYLGFTNAGGIKALTLSNVGKADALGFDQFQIGTLVASVPETTTWGMMIVGMFGAGMMMRARTTRRASLAA